MTNAACQTSPRAAGTCSWGLSAVSYSRRRSWTLSRTRANDMTFAFVVS